MLGEAGCMHSFTPCRGDFVAILQKPPKTLMSRLLLNRLNLISAWCLKLKASHSNMEPEV